MEQAMSKITHHSREEVDTYRDCREKRLDDPDAMNALLAWAERGLDARYFRVTHLDCRDSHILWCVRLECEAHSWSADQGPYEELHAAVRSALAEAAKEGFE